MKNSFLFCGYYGHRNTGDDAFCRIASWAARKYWDARTIRFLARSLPAPLQATDLYIRDRFGPPAWIRKIAFAAGADRIVFCGGSIFHDKPAPFRITNLLYHLSRIPTSKKFAAVGVSLGPFPDRRSRDFVRSFLGRFDFVATRDSASQAIARSLGLEARLVDARDPAYLLPFASGLPVEAGGPVRKDGPRVIGVSLRRYESLEGGDPAEERRRLAVLRDVCSKLAGRKFALKFLVFNGDPEHGDASITGEFRDGLGSAPGGGTVPYRDDPAGMLEEVGACDFVLAVRLHAAIFAHMKGVPFLLTEYHRKCGDFLDDIGYSDEFRIGDAVPDAAEIVSRIERIIDRGRKPWETGAERMREAALSGFTAAREILGGLERRPLRP